MYHEEKWMDGRLYWRGTPDGAWIQASYGVVSERLQEAEQKLLSYVSRESKDAERYRFWRQEEMGIECIVGGMIRNVTGDELDQVTDDWKVRQDSRDISPERK